MIDLSRVDWEKKLDKILVEGALDNLDAPRATTCSIIQIDAEKEEVEEGGNPHSLP